jgi:hypothetical protein
MRSPTSFPESKTPALDWAVTALLPEAALGPGDRLPIVIATKDVAASGIRLGRHSIQAADKTLPAGNWALCDDPVSDRNCVPLDSNAASSSSLSIAANDAKNLWIKVPEGDSLVGKYTGSFWISADQSKPGTALPVTFYKSSEWRWWVGMITLAVSVVAWIFGVGLRARANRLQLDRPFSILRSQQQALETQYGKLHRTVKESSGTYNMQLLELKAQSTSASLKGVIGYGWPSAFGVSSQPPNQYSETLKLRSDKTALLKTLMEEGLLKVDRNSDQATAGAAAGDIAEISTDAAVDARTSDRVAAALAKLHPAAPPDMLNFLAKSHRIQFREPTTQSIDVALQSLSSIAWLFLAVGSIAVGWYVLIHDHPGFGTYTDYFLCTAWGFGLPVGASGLAPATTTTVATALKIGV